MSSFTDFDLDNRIQRALNKMGFSSPTLIQEQVIKIAAEGKDIIARGHTGSGKTLAYCIPILNKILQVDQNNGIKSIMLVPTRDLAQQVYDVIQQLTLYCSKEIEVVNLCRNENAKPFISSSADIIVATPSRLRKSITPATEWTALQSVAIDEADLLLSFGYEDDLNSIISLIPRQYQAFMMSATLSNEASVVSKMFLRNPVTLKLENDEHHGKQLTQYSIMCSDEDRFLLLFFILKLKLIQGKCMIFVSDIKKGYKVKLFLEQFAIKSCVLNNELPFNSRYHIVQEFNRGIYDYIIATDDGGATPSRDTKSNNETDFGVARGIDFVGVSAVINFDFPPTVKSYIHRVGRTARGHASGLAISFISEKDKRPFSKVEYKQKALNTPILPYEFDGKQLEGFRYRCDDALRTITKGAVQEARLKEIRVEILNSEKLKAHFDANPQDLVALRHDKPISGKHGHNHLKHIPDYLLPKGMKSVSKKINAKEVTKRKYRQKAVQNKNKNPLKSLSFS